MRWDLRLRNRGVIVFVLPVVIPLWLCGWVLYCVGARFGRRKGAAAVSSDGLEIRVGLFERDAEVSA